MIDSNTLSVIANGLKQEVVLYGICSTGIQKHDNEAEQLLKSLIAGRELEIIIKDKDEPCRDQVVIFVDGENLNEAMIRNGRALVDKTCTADFCSAWITDEKDVQSRKTGLWHRLDFSVQQQKIYAFIRISREEQAALRKQYVYTFRHSSIINNEESNTEYSSPSPNYSSSYSSSDSGRPKTQQVSGYRRKNGTYVQSYHRAPPR